MRISRAEQERTRVRELDFPVKGGGDHDLVARVLALWIKGLEDMPGENPEVVLADVLNAEIKGDVRKAIEIALRLSVHLPQMSGGWGPQHLNVHVMVEIGDGGKPSRQDGERLRGVINQILGEGRSPRISSANAQESDERDLSLIREARSIEL